MSTGIASIKPADISEELLNLQTDPITASDVQAEMSQMSMLFPEPRRQTIFDLASDLSAGLAAQAASGQAPSIGYGLAAGFNAFSEGAELKRLEAEKIRQQAALMAYQQVEAKRAQQLELSKEYLEQQFDLALEQGGFMEGTSSLASALNYVVRAEKNPALKDTPEYALAVAVAKQPKVTLQQTETGTIPVEQPGIDVEGILSSYRKNQANTITDDNGVTWTPTGKTFQGKPVYSDGTNEAVF